MPASPKIHIPYKIPISSIIIKHLHWEVGLAVVNDLLQKKCSVTLMVAKSIAIHIFWIFWHGAFSIITSSLSYIFIIYLVNYYSILTHLVKYDSDKTILALFTNRFPKGENYCYLALNFCLALVLQVLLLNLEKVNIILFLMWL